MRGIAMRRRARRDVFAACRIVAVLAPVLLSGCRGSCAAVALDDSRLAAELRGSVAQTYPARLTAVHRAILTAHGREFAFTGYVVADRPDGVRLLATSEFGSTVFEVERSASGAKVVRSMKGLRDAWLVNGAARDAFAVYLAAPGEDARLVRHADGCVGFVEDGPGGTTSVFAFDPETRFLARYAVARRGRVAYEARFYDFGPAEGSPIVAPRRIDIVDRRLGYSLSIQVLRLQAAN